MAKYKNIQELAGAFKSGKLKDWVLMVDNDSTYLRWNAGLPDGIVDDADEAADFQDKKSDEGEELWDSPEVYILGEALTAAGIPNMGV
ncbi:hypothetical protein LCGC14_0783570 [marine sediment metagenome]|uniref:Uncharacterized protein n=1 Tax=marine sediment metagenome TaxID=412755 RepID=A0A0F9PZ20_9ZZZZ